MFNKISFYLISIFTLTLYSPSQSTDNELYTCRVIGTSSGIYGGLLIRSKTQKKIMMKVHNKTIDLRLALFGLGFTHFGLTYVFGTSMIGYMLGDILDKKMAQIKQ